MIRLAPEGYPFILVFAALSIASGAVWGALAAAIPVLLTFFMVYFFRDPERNTPAGPGIFASPADGEIILIKDVREDRYLLSEAKQVSIFMSPFDVHVNRAPCSGRVKKVRHNKGCFFAAYKECASIKNENIEMVLETEHGDILVRQVAGFLARRAVCRKTEGDILSRGERYGMIKFSSRVDLYLPRETFIRVSLGDKVKAGESVIGEIFS